MAFSSFRSENRWNYDVFLSFRGTDTRNTFTSHLHQALLFKGINVFIDTELQRGKVITSELLRVIEESRISIVVLSENYASSSFCLDELQKILESRESKKQIVIPIFYHVDPTDVEEQRGTFGQEFAQLGAQLNKHLNSWKLFPSIAATFLRNVNMIRPTIEDLDEQINIEEESTENIMDRIQKWRLALTKVAQLSGWHLKKWDRESKIIQEIIKKVWKNLNYTPLHVAEHPVGLTLPIEYILKKLNMESQEVCMVGLYGMGGVGKTTIAAALYNTCVSQFDFEGSCFLSKVREESKKHGIVKLQQTLLAETLGELDIINNSMKGIELIKRRLRNKNVLVVIDDVDHREQLQQLVGGLDWFGRGSVIIITTRNSHLLEQHGVTMMHEIKELKFDEALQLFSWHAFKEPQPNEGFMDLSNDLIRYTRGLPLALIVLGSSLYKRSMPQWHDMLKKLKRNPNKEINDILKVSYDSLDSEEKVIFLDIAFFLKGKCEDEVAKFLDACGFGAHLGIKRLIQNSLVYVDRKGKLEMHDLLEAMGTKIAYEECSRLCIREREDILRLFINDKRHDVEILVWDLYGEEEVSLNWLQNLKNLRVLVIRHGSFIKIPNKLPNSIRWLEWSNSCLKSITSGFFPPNLFVLEMPYSSATTFVIDMPKAQKFMNLTRMNLHGSKHLREMVIDFSSIPNIKLLDLGLCQKLKKIHNSVASLKNLETFDLHGCCSLTSLPNLVGNQRLQFINLRDCSKLENLPNLPTTITEVFMENSGIKEIPFFFGNLTNLESIYASNCKNLTSVSNNVYKLFQIMEMHLENCPNLHQFPKAESFVASPSYEFFDFPAVIDVDLSGNKFVSLPINTFKFIYIRDLKLNNCEWLVEIPELPQTLWKLEARNCKSLVIFSQFHFEADFEGDFRNCHKMLGENEKKSWREMIENEWKMERKESKSKREAVKEWWLNEDALDMWRSYNIIVPGNKIPEWVSYAFGDPDFLLPSWLFNGNLIAIVSCVIFKSRNPNFSIGISIKDEAFFNMRYSGSAGSPLETEHMWFGFKYVDFKFSKLWEDELWCAIDYDYATVAFKRAGVHLIYKN